METFGAANEFSVRRALANGASGCALSTHTGRAKEEWTGDKCLLSCDQQPSGIPPCDLRESGLNNGCRCLLFQQGLDTFMRPSFVLLCNNLFVKIILQSLGS